MGYSEGGSKTGVEGETNCRARMDASVIGWGSWKARETEPRNTVMGTPV